MRSDPPRNRLPSPAVSYAVARAELLRVRRRAGGGVWLAVVVLGGLLVLVSTPVAFAVAREFGTELAAGRESLSTVRVALAGGWLALACLGLFAGLGSTRGRDRQTAVLTARPPGDLAGGLAVTTVLGYAPLVLVPALAAGAGLAVAVGTPAPLAGVLVAVSLALVSGTTTGFVLGLLARGLVERTPWLARHRVALALGLLVGYAWLAASGLFRPLLAAVGDALAGSPLGWLGDLALLTTPGTGATPTAAAGAVLAGLALVGGAVAALGPAAGFAWYAEPDRDPQVAGPVGGRIGAVLAAAGIGPATRGVTVTVLTRAARAPLQLVYVVVPLLFVLPVVESMVRTASAPDWAPWVAPVVGAWAAGAAFPLNLLGSQGTVLPAVLTTGSHGRALVRGHALAATVVFVPPTLAVALGAGRLAELPARSLLAVAAVTPVVLVAGAVLAAGLGALFPRFGTVALTSTRRVRPPSKAAFLTLSVLSVLAATAVGVVTDVRYRFRLSNALSTYLPGGLAVSRDGLLPYAWGLLAALVVLTPVAYLLAVRRIDGYRLG